MLQIAIGRRIFDTDDFLDDDSWLDFQSGIEKVVRDEHWISPNTRALGQSEFEGKSEETYVLVYFDCSWLSPETVRSFRILASAYQQFSIAVTFGETNFVKGLGA